VNLQPGHRQPATAVRRPQWRSFDFDGFCDNLHQSVLLTNVPDDCTSLLECYNSTLQSLLDQHDPFAVVKPTRHGTADSVGLPKWSRDFSSVPIDEAIPRQIEHLGGVSPHYFAPRCVGAIDYWSKTIADNANDSKALWSKLNVLLKTIKQSSSAAHTATDFADFLQFQGR